MRTRKPIINTQDQSLTVLPSRDEHGRVCLSVRLGEDGMGYNRSTGGTFRLTSKEARKLIKQLTEVTETE